MVFKRKKRRGVEETAAASDLAFLLIIYFIVIAGFNVNQGFIVNLPARDSTRLVLRDNILRFNLNSQGEIIYNNAITDINTVQSLIAAAHSENPEIAVVLSIDPQASWQDVVSFVAVAQRQNIEAFSFTMNRDTERLSY